MEKKKVKKVKKEKKECCQERSEEQVSVNFIVWKNKEGNGKSLNETVNIDADTSDVFAGQLPKLSDKLRWMADILDAKGM